MILSSNKNSNSAAEPPPAKWMGAEPKLKELQK